MHKLLLIDDDIVVTNIYRNKFSVEGFQVEIAADGQEGVDMVLAFKPDVIILDLMLPKMSGVEVLAAIRSLPDFKQLPIIVLSNTYLTNIVREAWKAGATKCLSKSSCNPAELVKMVRSVLGTGPQPGGGASGATSIGTAERTAKAAGEAAIQAELRNTFIESLPATLSIFRTHLRGLIRNELEAERLKQMDEFCHKVHALTGNAAIAGLHQIAGFSEAFEALLKELHAEPTNINASTLRTIASAIDFLGVLFEPENFLRDQNPAGARILVVDDEELSRRAVVQALEKAKLPSVSLEDPAVALRLLSENSYDLVFLDINMPGMSGIDLCSKMRTLPAQRATPVVFVTGLNDFESRANSLISGGTDFIAKPFLFMELAVKALVYVMRGRLEKNK